MQAFGGNRTSGSQQDVASALSGLGATGRHYLDSEAFIAHTLRGDGFDASEDGTGRGTPLVPIAFHPTQDPISSSDGSTHALGCGSTGGQASVAVAVALRGREGGAAAELAQAARFVRDLWEASEGAELLRQALSAVQEVGRSSGSETQSAHRTYAVRRLTVEECEFLQGFPRGYTRIPWRGKPADQCPDGPRYKALGNSWAVPVVRWIGERINAVEQIKHERKAA